MSNSISATCKNFIDSHREGFDYLIKYGTPTERQLLESIEQLAKEA